MEADVDEKCGLCSKELEPGSFPQLQFDGTWVCEDCIRKPLREVAAPDFQPRDAA